MGGRNPKPHALSILSGNKRRLKKSGLVITTSVPDSPAWLSDEAKAEWREIVPVLARMRVLSDADTIAVAQLADYLARWKHAGIMIKAMGGAVYPVKDELGHFKSFKRNPFVSIHLEYGIMVQRMLTQFGMTPSARARLSNSEEEQSDNIFNRNKFVEG